MSYDDLMCSDSQRGCDINLHKPERYFTGPVPTRTTCDTSHIHACRKQMHHYLTHFSPQQGSPMHPAVAASTCQKLSADALTVRSDKTISKSSLFSNKSLKSRSNIFLKNVF